MVNEGDVYGRLRVVELTRKKIGSYNRRVAICLCECGSEKVVQVDSLRHGNIVSCGCARRSRSSRRMSDYNVENNAARDYSSRSNAPAELVNSYRYATWQGIKQRCFNPRARAWPNYGGRGITMHEPWRDDFVAFARWLDDHLGVRPEGMTLDRIDNDGNYEPGNLRWATRQRQAANRRPYPVWRGSTASATV